MGRFRNFEVFQALLGEGNRLNGPQSRVNKIGFWLQASIFFIQVLIILPSAPKFTATTNNENTHQQFIFRSLQSVSSSNPEIADKVILGKEISKSVKCFPKTDVSGLWPFVSVRKNQRYDIVSSLLIETELSSLVQSTIVLPACLRRVFYLSW